MKQSYVSVLRNAYFLSNGGDPGITDYEVSTLNEDGHLVTYKLTTNYEKDSSTWYTDTYQYGDHFIEAEESEIPQEVRASISDMVQKTKTYGHIIPRGEDELSPEDFREKYRKD